MISRINLITIWTNQINEMKNFYLDILGFEIENDLGNYIEFNNEGVRFAICERAIMHSYSDEFKNDSKGQVLELAFKCEDERDLDTTYHDFLDKEVKIVKPPKVMPWGQKTCLFSDPDGNIHEIFTEIKN